MAKWHRRFYYTDIKLVQYRKPIAVYTTRTKLIPLNIVIQ